MAHAGGYPRSQAQYAHAAQCQAQPGSWNYSDSSLSFERQPRQVDRSYTSSSGNAGFAAGDWENGDLYKQQNYFMSFQEQDFESDPPEPQSMPMPMFSRDQDPIDRMTAHDQYYSQPRHQKPVGAAQHQAPFTKYGNKAPDPAKASFRNQDRGTDGAEGVLARLLQRGVLNGGLGDDPDAPLPQPTGLPSRYAHATDAHSRKVCMPCIYAFLGQCKKGIDCQFCHRPHTQEDIKKVHRELDTKQAVRRRAGGGNRQVDSKHN